jgi:hypothetical protein
MASRHEKPIVLSGDAAISGLRGLLNHAQPAPMSFLNEFRQSGDAQANRGQMKAGLASTYCCGEGVEIRWGCRTRSLKCSSIFVTAALPGGRARVAPWRRFFPDRERHIDRGLGPKHISGADEQPKPDACPNRPSSTARTGFTARRFARRRHDSAAGGAYADDASRRFARSRWPARSWDAVRR